MSLCLSHAVALLGSTAAPLALATEPPAAVPVAVSAQVAPQFAAPAALPPQAAEPPPASSQQDPRQEIPQPAEEVTPPVEAAPGNTIIVQGDAEGAPADPLVNLNEATFELSQDVDAALVGPMSEVYEEDIPKPLRNGLRNFLRNLMEPVNALNYLLQGNFERAAETVGRFFINSTVGVAGLIDIAEEDPFNLAYRRNGFANTLGFYGVGPGPFLVLPLVGATTLRDLIGSALDQAVVPFAVGAPFNTPYYSVPAYAVSSLQYRMEFDETLEAINTSVDPYFALRESYLCLREADIAALRDLPPPRDCSVEALMAAGVVAPPVAPDPAPAAPDAAGDPLPPAQIEAEPVLDVPAAPASVPESPAQPIP